MSFQEGMHIMAEVQVDEAKLGEFMGRILGDLSGAASVSPSRSRSAESVRVANIAGPA